MTTFREIAIDSHQTSKEICRALDIEQNDIFRR